MLSTVQISHRDCADSVSNISKLIIAYAYTLCTVSDANSQASDQHEGVKMYLMEEWWIYCAVFY